ILVTGIGIMNTTFHLARLKGQHYDLVLQIGVGGVYKKMLPLGTVVAISQDQLLGLGAEDIDGSLIDFYKNGLMNPNDYPYEHGIIINQHIDKLVGDSIYKVPAITVLTSSGCENTISLRE